MTKNRLIIFSLMLLMVFFTSFTGFTLAKKDGAKASSTSAEDKLVGVYITTDYIDSFDTEKYLSDHTDTIQDGVTLDYAESKEYNSRIYAIRTEDLEYDNEDPLKSYKIDFEFKGIDGFSYYLYDQVVPNVTTSISYVDPVISAANSSINVTTTDTGTKLTLIGNINTVSTGDFTCFYFNPVYQTADGELYLLPGTGMSTSGFTYGSSLSGGITEDSVFTQNGSTKNYSAEIKISVTFVRKPLQYTITEFNSNHELLTRYTYLPEEIPTDYTPDSSCSYLVVDCLYGSKNTDTVSERILYQPTDSSLTTRICREDGICLDKSTTLHWANQADNR